MFRAVIRSTRIFSMVPPRVRRDLIRMAWSVPSKMQSWQYILRILPLVSVPQTMPDAPRRQEQYRTSTFSVGRLTRKPSRPLPDLIQILSSWQSSVQYSTSTLVEDSMSMPSVRPWPWLLTVQCRIITLSQYCGTMFQKSDESQVMPSIRTLRQLMGAIILGSSTAPSKCSFLPSKMTRACGL